MIVNNKDPLFYYNTLLNSNDLIQFYFDFINFISFVLDLF